MYGFIIVKMMKTYNKFAVKKNIFKSMIINCMRYKIQQEYVANMP